MLPDNKSVCRMIQKAAMEGMPVSDLEYVGLPMRVINALEEEIGIIFLKQLIMCEEQELLTVNRIAENSINQIKKSLAKFSQIDSERLKRNKGSDRLLYYRKNIDKKKILA
jgi:DNA-directed RNA polymerase alpha subunit